MKVFVTGATGFVGSHLCDLLEKNGHEVFALVRTPKKAKEFNVPGTYISGSLSSSESNSWIEELPEDLDAVIHTAGIVHSMKVENFYSINSDSTKQLIEDLKSKYQNLKFTLISSLAAVGPTIKGSSLNELSEEQPVSEYGKSKLLAETYTKEHSPREWSINIVRPPMVIGPRDPAVLEVFQMINSGFVVTAGVGGVKKEYSFVCVYDLVDCISKTLESNTKEVQTYFGAFPKVITLEELYKELKIAMNKGFIFNLVIPSPLIRLAGNLIGILSKFTKIDIRLTPDKVNEVLPDAWVCESKKSQENLAMNYQWDLSKTVKAALKDYQKRNWL